MDQKGCRTESSQRILVSQKQNCFVLPSLRQYQEVRVSRYIDYGISTVVVQSSYKVLVVLAAAKQSNELRVIIDPAKDFSLVRRDCY